MEDEEAACVVALLHEVVPFIYFAEIELFQEDLSDVGGEVGEGEVGGERVGDDLPVLRLFLPEDVGEPFIDDFFSIILEGSHLPDLPPLLIISLLGGRFLGRQLEVAEGAE